MDTRTKIVNAEPRAGHPVKAVRGYFDPLTAAHARRLAELAEPGTHLMVVLADPPSPLLPARARAELVAALAVVDSVLLPDDGRLVEVDERAADLRRSQDLIEHVLERQRAE